MEILNVISLSDILSLFATIFVTFQVATYQLKKPRKNEIREQQLYNVYLPLYRLFYDKNLNILSSSSDVSDHQIDLIYNQIDRIFNQHYLLLKESLIDDFNILTIAMKENDKSNARKILNYIKKDIYMEYSLCKMILGYPHNKSFKFNLRIFMYYFKSTMIMFTLIIAIINLCLYISIIFFNVHATALIQNILSISLLLSCILNFIISFSKD
ncbi:hypothetical protein [Anaerofustis stercorihominis]|uniref:hypothetical protein n=1 Tax=Anaerofustis stercorihominis TaxID=214853 RepID=UPI0026734968|nr:hypothetical protein [Anaerofustis stercorihominis]